MTYCVAWKNSQSSFLISDTAITTNDKSETYKPAKAITSLGESSFHNKNISVEEWALKQFKVDDNFIICYSGSVDSALGIIKTLKRYYIKSNPLKSFELAIDSVRSQNYNETVQFLFSFVVDDKIKLYSYNAKNDCSLVEIPENTLVQIGSLSFTEYAKITNKMYCDHISKLKKSTEQFYQFLTYFQHLGLHENTMQKFAGGLYSGIYLDFEGCHWSDDTSITIYDRNLSDSKIEIKGRINYFIRHDCLVLTSSFTNQKEIFIDSPDHPVYKSELLLNEIEEIHYSLNPKIMVFLAKDERIMSTIKTNGKNRNLHFSDINNDGEFTTEYSYNFIQLLKGKFFPPNNLFNIHWDEIV